MTVDTTSSFTTTGWVECTHNYGISGAPSITKTSKNNFTINVVVGCAAPTLTSNISTTLVYVPSETTGATHTFTAAQTWSYGAGTCTMNACSLKKPPLGACDNTNLQDVTTFGSCTVALNGAANAYEVHITVRKDLYRNKNLTSDT